MHVQIPGSEQMVDPIFSATTSGELYWLLVLMDEE